MSTLMQLTKPTSIRRIELECFQDKCVRLSGSKTDKTKI